MTVSEGRYLRLTPGLFGTTGAFDNGAYADPNYDETLSDQINMLNLDGSWNRYIYTPDGWYDSYTLAPPANVYLGPGSAYYYYRAADSDFVVTF